MTWLNISPTTKLEMMSQKELQFISWCIWMSTLKSLILSTTSLWVSNTCLCYTTKATSSKWFWFPRKVCYTCQVNDAKARWYLCDGVNSWKMILCICTVCILLLHGTLRSFCKGACTHNEDLDLGRWYMRHIWTPSLILETPSSE